MTRRDWLTVSGLGIVLIALPFLLNIWDFGVTMQWLKLSLHLQTQAESNRNETFKNSTAFVDSSNQYIGQLCTERTESKDKAVRDALKDQITAKADLLKSEQRSEATKKCLSALSSLGDQ